MKQRNFKICLAFFHPTCNRFVLIDILSCLLTSHLSGILQRLPFWACFGYAEISTLVLTWVWLVFISLFGQIGANSSNIQIMQNALINPSNHVNRQYIWLKFNSINVIQRLAIKFCIWFILALLCSTLSLWCSKINRSN